MAVLKILQAGNTTLRSKAKPIQKFDKRIEKLLKDLGTTLVIQKDPLGVGLAASQVGKPIRLFIVKSGKSIVPFINPKIIWKSKKTNDPSPKAKIPSTKHETRNKMENGKWKMENTEREYIMEGCLSLPHYYGPVQRSKGIKVNYQLLTTNYQLLTTQRNFKGLFAQIIQHEVDHLNGILFIDRLLEQKRKLFRWKGGKWIEVDLP